MIRRTNILFALVLTIALLAMASLGQAATVRVGTYSLVRYEMLTETLVPKWREKHPDIDIEVELFANTSDMQNKLTVALGTDLVPDIVDTAGTLFFSHVVAGAVVDLSPYLSRVVDINDWLPHVIDEVSYPFDTKEGIYGLPYDWVGSVLIYNKDLFSQSGLAFPTEDWTWDDLRAAARSIARDVDGDGNNDIWGYYLPSLDHVRFDAIVRAYGGKVLADDRRTAEFGPGGEEVLQLYLDMIHQDQSTPPLGVPAPMAQGRTGMYVSGSFDVRTLDNAGDINYGVEMVPQGPVTRSMYGGSNLWVVMKRPSQEIDAVMRILAELVDYEAVMTTSSDYNLPSRYSLISQWELTPTSEVLARSTPYMRDGEWTPDWSQWQVAKRAELHPVLQQERPIPEGLQRAIDQVNLILQQAYR